MSWPRVVAARVRGLFRHQTLDAQLDDELRFHLDEQIEDNIRSGMSPAEARAAALRRFGAIESIKEHHREGRTVWWIEALARDVRHAFRVLRKSPVFTITAVVTLALALGANTAMLSVIDAVLLQPLPYRSADRLATVFVGERGDLRSGFATVDEWRRQSQSFSDFAVSDPVSLTLTANERADQVSVARVSPNLFPLLGVQPLHGRVFSVAEAEERQRVAVIGHRLWLSHFGASPGAVGSLIELDGHRSRIVGILPQEFTDADIWEPHTLFPDWNTRRQSRGAGSWFVVGRLKPGVSFEGAQEEMSAIARRLDARLPATERNRGVRVVPLSIHVIGPNTRVALWILMGAVLCVLLVAAANVASLSLARSAARDREMAVRSALGASRARIVSQLLAESVTLAVISGLLGAFVATGLIEVIRTAAPAELARSTNIALNGSVLASTSVLGVLTGLLIGLGPVMAVARGGVRRAGRDAGRIVSAGIAAQRVRRVLVVSEFALAIALAVGAGLLIRSLWSLGRVDSGFQPEGVLSLQVANPTSRTDAERVDIYTRILDEVRGLPGVEHAGLISDLFVSSASELAVVPDDRQAAPERMRVRRDEVSGQLFPTVGTSSLRGRDFSADNRPGSPRVAIVNDRMARRLWPERDAVGRRFTIGAVNANSVWWTVVGVVADMRRQGPEQDPIPQMFEPIAQNPPRLATLLIRTSAEDPLTMAEAVRAGVRRADTRTPLYGLTTLERRLAAYNANRRFQTSLLIGFAAVAVLLAAIGIYGLMHYAVTMRRQEIAMRLAIGADARSIFRMVIGEGLGLSAIGLAAGLVLALWVGQIVSSLLFGVTSTDSLTFVSVSILLTSVAAAACYIPARRAMKIDPVAALRQD